jgi:hypothetical protein
MTGGRRGFTMDNLNANKFVINLSKYQLDKDEISVLSRGMNFCPTPGAPDPGEYRTDLDSLHRRLRLRYHFRDDDGSEWDAPTDMDNLRSHSPFAHSKFKLPSRFNPPGATSLEAMILTNEMEFNKRPFFKKESDNLTDGERHAIQSLKSNNQIVVKPVDKGGAVCVMDRDQYLAEGYKQLSNENYYKKMDTDLTPKHGKMINDFIDNMLTNGEIDISVYNYLVQKEYRTPNLYLLPKVHKGIIPPPGRPILSANGSPTEKISQFVDHFLKPCATKHRSYIKDTTEFIQKLNNVGQLSPNSLLATFDVTSLYTNIPNKDGIFAAKKALDINRPHPGLRPSNNSLVQLMEFVLSKNNFKFNGEHFLQTGGTSMGTKMAPNFADLYIWRILKANLYTHTNFSHSSGAAIWMMYSVFGLTVKRN